MDINQILNYGLGIGAIFALIIQKYSNAYILFAVLLAWTILQNFVSGEDSTDMSFSKLFFLGFTIILFFLVFYLVSITIKHKDVFSPCAANKPCPSKNASELSFYMKSTNLLIVFVFLMLTNTGKLENQFEDMFPKCGNLIIMLILFLFTYLLGVLIVNVSIIINQKLTDG